MKTLAGTYLAYLSLSIITTVCRYRGHKTIKLRLKITFELIGAVIGIIFTMMYHRFFDVTKFESRAGSILYLLIEYRSIDRFTEHKFDFLDIIHHFCSSMFFVNLVNDAQSYFHNFSGGLPQYILSFFLILLISLLFAYLDDCVRKYFKQVREEESNKISAESPNNTEQETH